MEKYIEFISASFVGKDFRKFVNFHSKDEEVIDETELWKQNLEKEEPKMPKEVIAKIRIKPEDISCVSECFSFKESVIHPEDPQIDSLSIYTYDGKEWVVLCSIEEYDKKINEYYNNNKTAKRATKSTNS